MSQQLVSRSTHETIKKKRGKKEQVTRPQSMKVVISSKPVILTLRYAHVVAVFC